MTQTNKSTGSRAELGADLIRAFMPQDEQPEDDIFTRYVPTIDEFVTSPQYLGQGPLSKRQSNALQKIFGDDPHKIFTDKELPKEAVLLWGKGSGKDLVSSYAISYVAYVICCLKDPQGFFHLAQGEPIDIINVASNAKQALNVFFAKLKSRIARPCFADFKPTSNKDQIIFPNNLRLHSLHSQNEGWEGMNPIAWVMDEASAFRTSNGGDNADQVYSTLRSSAQSRFRWAHWIGIIISFPRKQEGDFTLNKYLESEHATSVWGDRGATWEINPSFEEGHPLYEPFEWVGVEELHVRVPDAFVDDFKRDGVDSMTKYLCNPPLTEGGFFEFPAAITEAVNRDLPPLVVTNGEREEYLKTGVVRRYVKRTVETYPPVIPDVPYYMHGDPGLTNDSFALAVAHVLGETKLVTFADGSERLLNKVVVDFVLTWDPKPNRPVDLLNVEETIEQIAQIYNIRQATFDRWNSAESIQRLIRMGVDAEDMNFSSADQFKMYRNLKLMLHNELIELPFDEATQNELKHLKVKNQKIEHDIYGKDRADAVAAVVWNAVGRDVSRVKQLVNQTMNPGFRRRPPPSYTIVRMRQ